jgi:large subunit ribosomal protein L10
LVTKNDKVTIIKELSENFASASAVFTTDQLGLTVSQISTLRSKLREHGAKYKIAKNTLIQKAAEGSKFEDLATKLEGPSAVLFCFNNKDIEPASAIKSFAKENEEKVVFKGAFLDGNTLNAEEAKQVAGLPSKDVLLSQIAGLLVNIPSSIAYIFDELSKKDADQSKLVKEFIIESAEPASVEENKGEEE